MFGRIVRARGDSRKLLLSLGANFGARLPGTLGALLFLPAVHRGLGTAAYAELLAALALGSAGGFLFVGVGVVARREVGSGYDARDAVAEADAAASTLRLATLAWLVSAVAVAAFGVSQHHGAAALAVAQLPLLAAYANIADNVRLAYNEHYVTAGWQTAFQIVFYAAGLSLAAVQSNLLLAALVLQLPYVLASAASLAGLLRRRPHLIGGSAHSMRDFFAPGMLVALAEGALMCSLNVGIVFLEARAPAETSAWFATVVRLFLMFLAPVISIMLPVSSFLRAGWDRREASRQRLLLARIFWFSAAYGVGIAVLLALASGVYVGRWFDLPRPAPWWQTGWLFLLMASIVLYKGFTAVAYLVLDLRRISIGAIAAMMAALVAAGIGYWEDGAVGAVIAYSGVAGLGLAAVLLSARAR